MVIVFGLKKKKIAQITIPAVYMRLRVTIKKKN